MKKSLVITIIAVLAYGYLHLQGLTTSGPVSSAHESDSTLQTAYRNQQSNLQVDGDGVVVRVLPDDDIGSRHQKFIVKTRSGLSLLISHNIDLAPRIPGLKPGDTIGFHGEYEWNSKGGVIHWTHHDPKKIHAGGWLKHNGNLYQ